MVHPSPGEQGGRPVGLPMVEDTEALDGNDQGKLLGWCGKIAVLLEEAGQMLKS